MAIVSRCVLPVSFFYGSPADFSVGFDCLFLFNLIIRDAVIRECVFLVVSQDRSVDNIFLLNLIAEGALMVRIFTGKGNRDEFYNFRCLFHW